MAAFRLLVVAILSVAVGANAAESDASPKFVSPDGKFALSFVEEDSAVSGVQIVRTDTGQVVADLSGDVMLSRAEDVTLVWSADSRAVAANFRAGGRYETTALYRREGEKFEALESPEGLLYEKVVKPARQRELKAGGKAADTSLRRIWDKWKTVRWIDAATVEIHGESTVSYSENDESVDIAVGVKVTVAFDEAGKPRVIKAEEVPASD